MDDELKPDEEHSPEDQETEVSLDALSAAFAELTGGSSRDAAPQHQADSSPIAPSGEGEQPPELQIAPTPDEEEADQEESFQVTPLSIVEALLFVGTPDNQPLSAEEAAAVMRGVDAAEVHQLIKQLNQRYAEAGCPYEIISEGAGYRMTLREEHARLRNKFHGKARRARLSQAAIDVLAIVAYNQPLSAEEVNELRGTRSNPILSQLVRRQLLRIERIEEKPRKTLYHTTGRFLHLIGLASLEDLPQTRELERQ